MPVLTLSLKNLFFQRRHYMLVCIAIIVGFALITLVSGVTFGSMSVVKDKAARYFSGHISVQKVAWPDHLFFAQDRINFIVKQSSRAIRTVTKRTVYPKKDALILFGGDTIRQRKLIGIDFEDERSELNSLDCVSGGIDAMLGETGKDGIMISTVTAKILGVRLGDSVNVLIQTDSGQYNSGTLIVRCIFSETSLFAYAAYMRRTDINGLLTYPRDAATELSVYIKDGYDERRVSEDIRKAIQKEFPVSDIIRTRSELYDLLNSGQLDKKMTVVPLNAQLHQIQFFLDALLIISYSILSVFILITMLGILNTYRVIVHERTKEIGTMRAVGIQQRVVTALFLTEAVCLACVASAVGFVVGLILLRTVSCLNMQHITPANFITVKGYLRAYVDIKIVCLNFAIMISSVFFAALGPARKTSAIRPAEAMRSEL